jgi:hypothetical protein
MMMELRNRKFQILRDPLCRHFHDFSTVNGFVQPRSANAMRWSKWKASLFLYFWLYTAAACATRADNNGIVTTLAIELRTLMAFMHLVCVAMSLSFSPHRL